MISDNIYHGILLRVAMEWEVMPRDVERWLERQIDYVWYDLKAGEGHLGAIPQKKLTPKELLSAMIDEEKKKNS